MRFCPHCGSPLLAAAKFCVQCGRRLIARGQKAGDAEDPNVGADLGFLSVFSGLVVAGALIAWVLIAREQRFDIAAGNPAVATASQSAQASEAGLPAGHPKIQLPAEALKFIQTLEQKAEQNPADVALWNQFGDVAFRAALLDPAFYETAARAYAHVLELDPDNLGALRGIGNINYDRHRYDEATAAYEHYLKEKPDDPAVRTDLGTLYLYTGNADQAVRQYNQALRVKPDFFEAYFNLGVAYNQMGRQGKALEALRRALKLAPDERARTQARQLMAEASGTPAQGRAADAGLAMNFPAPPSPGAQGSTDAGPPPDAGVAPPASQAASASAPAAAGNEGAPANAPLELAVVNAAGAAPSAGTSLSAGTRPPRAVPPSSSSASEPAATASPAAASLPGGSNLGAGNPGTDNPALAGAPANDTGGQAPSAGGLSAPGAGSASAERANTPAAPSGAADRPAQTAPAAPSGTGSFAGAIEVMVRQLPVAGSRVKAVEWPSQREAKVLLANFPMEQMPPFVKEKFLTDIKQGIDQAKKSYRVDEPFKLELADADSGRVMETVTQ